MNKQKKFALFFVHSWYLGQNLKILKTKMTLIVCSSKIVDSKGRG